MSEYETGIPLAAPESMSDADYEQATKVTHEILMGAFAKMGFKPGASRDSVAEWQAVAGFEAGIVLAANIQVNAMGVGSAAEASAMAQRFADAAREAMQAVREQVLRERASRN